MSCFCYGDEENGQRKVAMGEPKFITKNLTGFIEYFEQILYSNDITKGEKGEFIWQIFLVYLLFCSG